MTQAIQGERFPDSEVIFLAGSLVRNEGTSTSDLDLVVLYKNLQHAPSDPCVGGHQDNNAMNKPTLAPKAGRLRKATTTCREITGLRARRAGKSELPQAAAQGCTHGPAGH